MNAPPDTLKQITRGMVALYKEQFGRGPTSASTNWASQDSVVSVLRGTLTPVEVTMVGFGEAQRLREQRLMFQHAAEPRFRSIVEQATGRKVIAFTSGFDVGADLATEFFLLE